MNNLFSYNFSIMPNSTDYYYKLIFFIESSVNHSNKRLKIKRTWIKICLKISCGYYFILATKGCLEKAMHENNNNIIGIDIIDSYYNLTIFTSNIFKYYTLFNMHSDFIIKIDDDVYPNIPIIELYTNIYINKHLISGYYYRKIGVTRNKSSLIYLPKTIYPYDIFPNFVAGGFVITHSNLIIPIYEELKKQKSIIYREDMNMAIIYQKLNINFQKLNKYYQRYKKKLSVKMKKRSICWHGY